MRNNAEKGYCVRRCKQCWWVQLHSLPSRLKMRARPVVPSWAAIVDLDLSECDFLTVLNVCVAIEKMFCRSGIERVSLSSTSGSSASSSTSSAAALLLHHLEPHVAAFSVKYFGLRDHAGVERESYDVVEDFDDGGQRCDTVADGAQDADNHQLQEQCPGR